MPETDVNDILIHATVALDETIPGIQNIPQGDFGAAFAKMLLSLILLIALLWGTVYILRRLIHRRLQSGSATQSIQVVEKRMISPKTTLYLLDVEGETILMAESQLEVKKLSASRIPKSTD